MAVYSYQWKGLYEIFQSVICSSTTGALTATLDNAAAVDQGVSESLGNVNVVRIPATAHGLALNSFVYINGTTYYDGVYKLVAVATDTFDIIHSYTAETFAGTETAKFTLYPGVPFMLHEVRVTVDAAVSASENFTLDLDSGHGAAYDVNIATEPMSGLTSLVLTYDDERRMFTKDDKIDIAFANSDGNTVGVEVIYRIGG